MHCGFIAYSKCYQLKRLIGFSMIVFLILMIYSVWVMMNKKTRKLSKIPEEVRGEIEPYFLDSDPVVEEDSRKLQKLDDNTADYVRTGLAVSFFFQYN